MNEYSTRVIDGERQKYNVISGLKRKLCWTSIINFIYFIIFEWILVNDILVYIFLSNIKPSFNIIGSLITPQIEMTIIQ